MARTARTAESGTSPCSAAALGTAGRQWQPAPGPLSRTSGQHSAWVSAAAAVPAPAARHHPPQLLLDLLLGLPHPAWAGEHGAVSRAAPPRLDAVTVTVTVALPPLGTLPVSCGGGHYASVGHLGPPSPAQHNTVTQSQHSHRLALSHCQYIFITIVKNQVFKVFK